jgi:hypothetical protein
MKKSISYLCIMLVLSIVFITGCGGSSDKTYSASYSMENADQITGSHFFPNDAIIGMMATQNQIFVDYELIIEGEEYTLISKAFSGNPETRKAYEVGDDSAIAITILNTAKGRVLEQTDTSISIDDATSVTYSIPEDKTDTIARQMAEIVTLAEPGAESPLGTWSSEDIPELLKSVPATTFTVTEDGSITKWK